MTSSNITDTERLSLLKQLAQNNFNLNTFISERILDASATTIALGVISFPYKIRVLSSRIEAVAATSTARAYTATYGSSTFGTSLTANSTYVREKEDVEIAADTAISFNVAGAAGWTTANLRFMFDYAIDERRTL